MSSSKFVSNLDGMNDGMNFSKDLLKVRKLLVSGKTKGGCLLHDGFQNDPFNFVSGSLQFYKE